MYLVLVQVMISVKYVNAAVLLGFWFFFLQIIFLEYQFLKLFKSMFFSQATDYIF